MAAILMGKILLLTILLAAVFWGGAVAQSSGCISSLTTLSPCEDFITGNSSTPSSSCCTNLATLAKSKPACLCEVINGDASSSIKNLNQTLAMELPAACKDTSVSSSLCNASTGSPSSSPSGTTTKSDGNNIKMEFSLLFFSVLFALGSSFIAI